MSIMNMFYKPKNGDLIKLTYSDTQYKIIETNDDGTFNIKADTGLKLNDIKAKDIIIISRPKSGGSRRKSRKTKRSRKTKKSRKSRRKMTKRRRR